MINEMFVENNAKLVQLLKTANNKNAFYKNNSLYTKKISKYSDWSEIPILTKEQLQTNMNIFLNENFINQNSDLIVMHTSGSTCKPIKVVKSRKNEIKLTKKLWKKRIKHQKDIMSWKTLFLYRDIESKHMNILRLGNDDDYLDLSLNNLERYTKQILEYEPQWIIGPPIGVTRLANYFKDNNIKLKSLELVEVFGEMLLSGQRKMIEDALNVKVINHYGSRETGVISYECPYGQMHAWSDELFIEVIKDGKHINNGEVGEIVVTTLNNAEMPLIRYALGDLVRIQMLDDICPCGDESRLLIIPEGGRIAEYIITKNKIVSSGLFDTLFSRFYKNYENVINEFQVIQESKTNFKVNIVKGANFEEKYLQIIEESITNKLGEVTIQFDVVSIIPSMRSGKTKTFVPLDESIKLRDNMLL